VTVRPGTLIPDLVGKFIQEPTIRHVYVVNAEGKMLGVISRKRSFHTIFIHYMKTSIRVSKMSQLLTAEKAEDIMETHVVSVSPNDTIIKVIKTMMAHDLNEIPVVETNNEFLGAVNALQILKMWGEDTLYCSENDH
jgi:CBS domain-containing protein